MRTVEFKSYSDHEKQVEAIRKTLSEKKGKVALLQGKPSNALHNENYKKDARKLDLSQLNEILTIDLDQQWVMVEPRMSVRQLCHITLQYGLVPPVVPEFSSITVGGAIMGAALESSSHRYGQFSDTTLEYELILGDGSLVIATPENEPELFYGISGSYGSLAIITLVKLKLIPAKTHVHLTYVPYDNSSHLLSSLKKPTDADFIEGILFSRSQGSSIQGEMAPYSNKLPEFRQNHYWSPWYYQHVYDVSKKGTYEEQMPLEEYLFRLDRGAFWMGRYLLSFSHMFRLLLGIRLSSLGRDLVKKGKNKLTFPSSFFRYLFGWAFLSHILYGFWHRVPSHVSETLFLIHDFYTPSERVDEALSLFLDKTEIFPIWLCPIKGTQAPQFLSPHYGKNQFINIGLYGIPKSHSSLPAISAELEKEILNLGGRKMLYSFTYYDKELFEKEYEDTRYSALRKKYCAENVFLSLYNKVVKPRS